MNEVIKYFILTLCLLALVTTITFNWDNFFAKSDVMIDPEYFSGMLGAVSIVFSIFLWAMAKEDTYRGLVLTVFLLGPLMMLLAGVGRIIEVSMGRGNPEATLYWLAMTLAVTILGLFIFTVYKNVKSLDEDKKKLVDL